MEKMAFSRVNQRKQTYSNETSRMASGISKPLCFITHVKCMVLYNLLYKCFINQVLTIIETCIAARENEKY